MAFPSNVPFALDLGLQLLRMEDGESELLFEPAERHLNSFRVAHGGTVMTLMDAAMSLAARSTHGPRPEDGPGAVTVEMKTSFLRPGEGRLHCRAKVLHRTATLAFCEASVWMANEQLMAHATGTFKFVRALTGEGRRLKPVQNDADSAPA